jgi:hypothetical protein
MRLPDRSGPNRLTRYWAALNQGAPASELARMATSLDPAMLRTIEGMRSMRDDPRPDPAFVARLEGQLIHAASTALLPGSTSKMDEPAYRFPAARRPESRLSQLLPIAMTAAMILALFGGFFAGRHTDWGTAGPTATAPAIQAPGTPPETGLTDATLLDVVFPAELLPTEENRIMGFGYVYVDPGSAGNWFPSCCDGPMFEFVLSGSLTITSQEAVQVLRADRTFEEIGPDVEIVLDPGDALITRNRIGFEYANTETTPVELLEWLYLDDPIMYFAGHPLPGWGGPGGLDVTSKPPFFTDPVRVTLQRHVLDPEEMVGSARTDGILLVVTANVETDIVFKFGDGAFKAVDSGGKTTTIYSLDVAPTAGNSDLQEVGLPPD